MKTNPEYWKARFELLEEAQHQRGAKFVTNAKKVYSKALDEIEKDILKWFKRLADNNGISLSEARKLLTANELEEFKWSVEKYIKVAKNAGVNSVWEKQLENALSRSQISRLQMLQMQIRQHMEVMGVEYDTELKEFIIDQYEEHYYHVAHEMATGTNVAIALQGLDTVKLEKLIAKPWTPDGQTFSDRIWRDKEVFVNRLYTEISQSLARGIGPEETVRLLYKELGSDNSRYQIRRVVMTESAFFSSTAQKDVFNDLDVEEYQYIATLDSKTSKICQTMDNKVFDMKDYIVGSTAPPLHPFCRSVTVPYFEDGVGERFARNAEGEGVYVPSDMSYKEWKEKFIN